LGDCLHDEPATGVLGLWKGASFSGVCVETEIKTAAKRGRAAWNWWTGDVLT